LTRAVIRRNVRKEGKANWDVMKDTSQAVTTETKPSSSGMEDTTEKKSQFLTVLFIC